MTSLAVDIGGTKIAAARVSPRGDLEGRVLTAPTPAAEGPHAVLEVVVAMLRRLGLDDISEVGVSSAGVIDSSTGTVLGATASIDGWTGTQIGEQLSRATRCPVFALGDGHAFALGEALYGSARGAESVLVLAVGTGVGGSYVAGGTPMTGSHSAGGHFGHIAVPQADGMPCECGKVGHLEAVAGGAGMLRWYHANGGDGTLRTARELFEAASGDEAAEGAIRLGASAVGTAAGGLTNAFDPDLVVIAGGLSQAGPRWEQPLRAAFAQNVIPALSETSLLISEAGAWLALRGAAYYAHRRKVTA